MFKSKIQITNNISPMIQKQAKAINRIPDEAFKMFVKETPVRSGNARRKTKLKNKKQIFADYNYAQKLDEGYSQQSPEGMVKPTEEFIIKTFNNIMSGK